MKTQIGSVAAASRLSALFSNRRMKTTPTNPAFTAAINSAPTN